jgi:hypothetical protein
MWNVQSITTSPAAKASEQDSPLPASRSSALLIVRIPQRRVARHLCDGQRWLQSAGSCQKIILAHFHLCIILQYNTNHDQETASQITLQPCGSKVDG